MGGKQEEKRRRIQIWANVRDRMRDFVGMPGWLRTTDKKKTCGKTTPQQFITEAKHTSPLGGTVLEEGLFRFHQTRMSRSCRQIELKHR